MELNFLRDRISSLQSSVGLTTLPDGIQLYVNFDALLGIGAQDQSGMRRPFFWRNRDAFRLTSYVPIKGLFAPIELFEPRRQIRAPM